MVEPQTDRVGVLRTTLQLMDAVDRVELLLDEVTRRTNLDHSSIDEMFGSWETLLDLAHGERFLQQQATYLHAFHHDVVRSRTQSEFIALVEQHLRATYASTRSPQRKARLDILSRCNTHPELASAVAQATKRGSRILGEAFSLAQTRGWVDRTLDTNMLGTWLMGHVYGRVLLELDDSYTPEQCEAWDRISIDAVLTALGRATPASVTRRSRRWGRRATA